jgi:hypothetical protein
MVFMLCAPLLLYAGYRLCAKAWDDNMEARTELRDKFKFQAASFLPGAICLISALVIGFVVFDNPMQLSKAEAEVLSKPQQGQPPGRERPAAPSPSPVPSPGKKTGASGATPPNRPV